MFNDFKFNVEWLISNNIFYLVDLQTLVAAQESQQLRLKERKAEDENVISSINGKAGRSR
jgi:hypothetical protein